MESVAEVERILERDPSLWLPDNLYLLQELCAHDPARGIVRLELLGGELLYAMRVVTHGRFNLCPAPVCNPDDPAEGGACAIPDTTAKPVEFFPFPEVPAEAVATAKRIAAAAGIDVGGIEFLVDDRDGRWYVYDINALSNFVADAPNVVGFDPWQNLVDYLESRLATRDSVVDDTRVTSHESRLSGVGA